MEFNKELHSERIALLSTLFTLGDCFALNFRIDFEKLQADIDVFSEHFKPYNPRKIGYNRFGLSITSLDGGLEGVPDLDSLYEYNKNNKTNYTEMDFRKLTPIFESSVELRNNIGVFSPYLGRSHFLRLDKGGFFPPHRDSSGLYPDSIRVFASLHENMHSYAFILNEKKLLLEPGRLYVINTRLDHSLFSFCDKNDFMVLNLELSYPCVDTITKSLYSF